MALWTSSVKACNLIATSWIAAVRSLFFCSASAAAYVSVCRRSRNRRVDRQLSGRLSYA
jgi:hypothetical protein